MCGVRMGNIGGGKSGRDKLDCLRSFAVPYDCLTLAQWARNLSGTAAIALLHPASLFLVCQPFHHPTPVYKHSVTHD